MKIGWKILLVVIFIVFPLFLIILAYFKWTDIKDNFFSFSIKDIITLVSTGYIGIVVMVVFSTISNNSRKRLEIITENLNMLQDFLGKTLNIFIESINSSINENTKNHLVQYIKIISIEYTTIKEFLKTEKNDKITNDLLKNIGVEFIRFKKVITDRPFQKEYIINEIDSQDATNAHNKIRQNTQRIKLNLYK
jgi:hypothetical protein